MSGFTALQPAQSPHTVRIGQSVRKRLLENPNTVQLPSQAIDLFVVRDFLDLMSCLALIEMIERDHSPSTLLQETEDEEFRTSSTCYMDRENRIVRVVEDRLEALTGIPLSHGETIQGQRYVHGQQFKPHNDYFYRGTTYWDKEQTRGGQRTWTVMICLNDVESGGHTRFPLLDLEIAPKRGNAIAWNNLDYLGRPNPMTLHQGMPVQSGRKFIVTKWYRERKLSA
ncbi:MAG: 2OG-Fe(II) oxygenase [Erythrobacter sp.]